jgi:hypothetical protein
MDDKRQQDGERQVTEGCCGSRRVIIFHVQVVRLAHVEPSRCRKNHAGNDESEQCQTIEILDTIHTYNEELSINLRFLSAKIIISSIKYLKNRAKKTCFNLSFELIMTFFERKIYNFSFYELNLASLY